MSYCSFTQTCPSASLSTPSKVVIDKVRMASNEDWIKADNVLHMLALLQCEKAQDVINALQEDDRELIFLLVNAGQHRAKVKHLFRDLEEKQKLDPNLKDHPLQEFRMQQSFDPTNLPRYSQAQWLNTTTTTISVGLPPGVSS